ncbi:MAG TPA: hypothetical protein PLY70_14420 [Saprospiraceae bacterium]|nr:hypothetical protein [Saprospiraceae bacterium]HPN67943.1 hypothetical protein [Saprospiraceae bacterium]
MTQTMHTADFKAKFSEVVKLLEQGVTIKVIKGRAGEVVGYFSKKEVEKPKIQRTAGLLQNEKFELSDDFFTMATEELEEWGVFTKRNAQWTANFSSL